MELKKIIQLITSNKLAIKNNGTLEQLEECLKYIFPEGNIELASLQVYCYAYYYFGSSNWHCSNTLPKGMEEINSGLLIQLLKTDYMNVINTLKSIEPPPLGLIPKQFYNNQNKAQRFDDVDAAIKRYHDAGLKIDVKWIEEYNELLDENEEQPFRQQIEDIHRRIGNRITMLQNHIEEYEGSKDYASAKNCNIKRQIFKLIEDDLSKALYSSTK